MACKITCRFDLRINMIIRLLFAAVVLYGLYRFVKLVQSKPAKERRAYYVTLVIGLSAAALVLLSLTGRVPWIAGLIGGALPFIRQLALKYAYNKIGASKQQDENSQGQSKPKSNSAMNRAQALSILGLKADASKDDIIAAHRKLMQKIHPDRGGNDFLASQINDAKDILLDDPKV
ncbi:DnaJ domain-containing protein [Zhongshania sp. CAU 1632]|uniref:DnaJ domain-containing protein n=2 Tax=Zhongshania aquimaris TaxID=2857107 RepID=A0ABS6VNJ8_9GAMM|nr:DnaJ domain-containing protein [Zhongshania aquimaris]